MWRAGAQELYGNQAAGRLLSGFSRLFTHFLQGHGFTCGIDDVLLSPAAEMARSEQMRGAERTALAASALVAGLPEIKVRIGNPDWQLYGLILLLPCLQPAAPWCLLNPSCSPLSVV